MTNPLIPGITAAEQDVLYQKLNEYNLKKASFKEVGAYLVVLPRADCPRYSLWIYSPLPERQSIFYIFDLSEDIHEALRMASTLCYYSPLPLNDRKIFLSPSSFSSRPCSIAFSTTG